jgi:CheY-like chemotaxis protein
LTVLIVDDDPWILRMVSTVLAKRGYNVVSAADGQEAYLKAMEAKPDLIITDVMMPRMDGWGLVRTLRSRAEFALVPVIFLTALGGDDDRIHGFRLGADDYLPKPFRFEELDLRVANALRKRKEVMRTVDEVRVAKPPPIPPAAARKDNTPAQQTGTQTGIHGSLEQLGPSSLLALLEMEHKSGMLMVKRDNPQKTSARLYLQRGRIVSARIDAVGIEGANAVYQVVTWSRGHFDFTAMEVEMEDSIGQTTTQLLLEGARRIDEGI